MSRKYIYVLILIIPRHSAFVKHSKLQMCVKLTWRLVN